MNNRQCNFHFESNATFEQPINGVLSYPLFFTLRNTFESGQSLYNLQNTLQQYQSAFKNLDLLGTFIGMCNIEPKGSTQSNITQDNHDQPRFLNGNSDYKVYQNALTYVLLAQVWHKVY